MTRTNSLATLVLVASATLGGCGGDPNVSSGALAAGHGRLRLAVTEAAKTGEADLPAGSYQVTVAGKVTPVRFPVCTGVPLETGVEVPLAVVVMRPVPFAKVGVSTVPVPGLSFGTDMQEIFNLIGPGYSVVTVDGRLANCANPLGI